MSTIFQVEQIETADVLDHLEKINNLKKIEYDDGVGCIPVGIHACTVEGQIIISQIPSIPHISLVTTLICGQTCNVDKDLSYESM